MSVFVVPFLFSVQNCQYLCAQNFLSVEVTRTLMSKRFPNKDLLLSRLLESKNGNQIWNDKMIVYIIIIAAFQTHYNINMKLLSTPFSESASATVTTLTSFELTSLHARVTSNKFTKQHGVMEWVSVKGSQYDRTQVNKSRVWTCLLWLVICQQVWFR